jgi:hypothetical protein
MRKPGSLWQAHDVRFSHPREHGYGKYSNIITRKASSAKEALEAGF